MSSLDGSTAAACVATPAKAGGASRYYGLLGMALFVVAAIVAHGLILNSSVFPDEDADVNLGGSIFSNVRTHLFAGVGIAFLACTWLSHLPISMALRGNQSSGNRALASSPTGEMGPLGGMLISMAIRVAATFAILGLLWKGEFVSREESVFDVLFWYVTLTTMEVVGIVWASRSLIQSSPTGNKAPASDT